MKAKCIIVDDEPIARKIIKTHLKAFKDIEIVAECKNAIEAFDVIAHNKIDLIFLDIHMPQISGINFLKTLKNPPKVIITTAHRDYAIEGYELDVVDFLLKPISFDRFMKAINKFYSAIENNITKVENESVTASKAFIYVKSGSETHKIFLDDIIYLESFKEHLLIHTNKRTIKIIHKIGDIENKLSSSNFLRIHKSYIVSINKIESFSLQNINIGKQDLPIGRTYKKSVMNILMDGF